MRLRGGVEDVVNAESPRRNQLGPVVTVRVGHSCQFLSNLAAARLCVSRRGRRELIIVDRGP